MICFKVHSTALLISDTLALDSVKLLVPRGYYILNEAGAKSALKAKIDAQANFQLWQIADKTLTTQTSKLAAVVRENNEKDSTIKSQAGTIIQYTDKIKTLNRRLFWANAWKWAATGGASFLALKLFVIPQRY